MKKGKRRGGKFWGKLRVESSEFRLFIRISTARFEKKRGRMHGIQEKMIIFAADYTHLYSDDSDGDGRTNVRHWCATPLVREDGDTTKCNQFYK